MPQPDAGGLPPLFLSHTPRERDEFVRALGLVEEDEAGLLNLLCSFAAGRRTARVHTMDLLAAVGSWARSHARPALLGGAAKGALRRLLAVLERNGYATTDDDWETILLRDGDRLAGTGERAVAAIAKAYRDMEADPLHPYPASTDIRAPATALQSVSSTEFSPELIRACSSSTKIIRIVFPDDLDVLATSDNLPRLYDVARARVQFHIGDNPNLYAYTLLELKKIPQFRQTMDHQRLRDCLEGRRETPSLFWVYVGQAIARAGDPHLLEPRNRSGRLGLIQSGHLVHSYYQFQHKVETEQKQRETDKAAVVEWVRRSGRGFSMEELTDIRDESGSPLKDRYPDAGALVTELLVEVAAQAEADGRVAPIVSFADLWMHRDAVLPLLREEIATASEQCRRLAEAEWRPKLEKGVVDEPAMTDDNAFDAWLSATIAVRCPRLQAMLRSSRLVHLVITEDAARDVTVFRTHSALFESFDDPTWKSMSRMLGLDRLRIVGNIVWGLSLLRRLILRWRLKLRKPRRPALERGPRSGSGAAAGAPAPVTPAPVTPALGDVSAGSPPEGGVRGTRGRTIRASRRRRSEPPTILVEKPSRRDHESGSMDEAMDKLKQAMSKQRK